MKKQIIRLTESDIHNIIKESVRKALNERFTYSEPEELTVTEYIEFPPELCENPDDNCAEVEFYVTYDFAPEEAQTYDYPGSSEDFSINDVDFNKDNLTEEEANYIETVWLEDKKNWEQLEEDACNELHNGFDEQYGAYENAMENYYDRD